MAPVALPNIRDFSSRQPQPAAPADAGTATAGASPFSLIFGQCLTSDGISDFAASLPGADPAGDVSTRQPGGPHQRRHSHHGKGLLDAGTPDSGELSGPSV